MCVARRRASSWALIACLMLGCCRIASAVEPAGSLVEFKDWPILQRYIETCRLLQVMPSADAIVFVQLEKDFLAISTGSHFFGDLEMQALVSLLEDDNGAALKRLRRLDLAACNLEWSGMMLVANLLEHPQCDLEVLDLSNQPIDHACILTIVRSVGSMNIKDIGLKACHLGDVGGETILSMVTNNTAVQTLKRIDLRNNFISFDVCAALNEMSKTSGVRINLSGNRVLDEILNAASHALAEVLAIVGTIMIGKRVGCDQPLVVRWSIGIYLASLHILYTCSTLFHAFFALGRVTVLIFGILDYAGSFVLIAGSFSAVLGALFYREVWTHCLLFLLWVSGFIGIGTAAFDTGPFAHMFRLILYFTMGGVVILVIVPVTRKLGCKGGSLILIGGFLYLGGVPFFFRDGHTHGIPDHTIWHLFVVAGSVAHYLCVYLYIIPMLAGQKPDMYGPAAVPLQDLSALYSSPMPSVRHS